MSKQYLIFDTETTGLPKNYTADTSDVNNWPRLVQLAWSIYNQSGEFISSNDLLIIPDGFVITKEASDVHGITTEKATESGVTLEEALNKFKDDVVASDVLVAHNISFDRKIIGCEYFRLQQDDPFKLEKQRLCTMRAMSSYMKSIGQSSKFMKLMDLHIRLFGSGFTDAHDAKNDVDACARCLFKMIEMGII